MTRALARSSGRDSASVVVVISGAGGRIAGYAPVTERAPKLALV
jgi:hypothetical protein